ncbi:MAG: prenyltransferase/squalene oxidase repeat-containing protein [Lentisphaerota bacterium]
MNNAQEEKPESSTEGLLFETPTHQPTLKEMLGELSMREWIQSVCDGLRQPKSSGEYTYAVQQINRLWAPVCGVFFPLLLIGVLLATPQKIVSDKDAIPVTIEASKVNEALKDDPKTKEPDPEPPPPDDTSISPDPGEFSTLVGPPGPVGPATGPSTPFSPQPAAFDSVAMIKSAIKMKGVYAGRTPGMIGTLTGGGPGGGGGDRGTEEAVMRALRWLKKNQNADGSWDKCKPAMTGLAVLTFLAHGEKPGSSPEFGETVKKALEYLLYAQKPDGHFANSDGNEYSMPIAAYALCEAYGMTMNPGVGEAAGKTIEALISGQNLSGGWDYKAKPSARNDTSYMGWCAQALKAAYLSSSYANKPALEAAIKKAIKGFQCNYQEGGGFGYDRSGAGGLSAVGTLCLQLLGANKGPEVRTTLALMEPWIPTISAKDGAVKDAKDGVVIGGNTQYYYYYATQAKFHAGGKPWEAWNARMKLSYPKAMIVEKGVYTDHLGKPQDIGHWVNDDSNTDRPVMDTCLVALQLMVYYRNLPTTNKDAVDGEDVAGSAATNTGDIQVNTGNL